MSTKKELIEKAEADWLKAVTDIQEADAMPDEEVTK